MTFDIVSFLGGLTLIPIAVAALWAAGALTGLAWEKWELVLRRLRPRRIPDWRNATLAAHIAEWPGKVRSVSLPGVWCVVLTERPLPDDFDARRKATEARIRDGVSAADQAFPPIAVRLPVTDA
ncbi:hypothetical protein JN535_08665 [Cellulosimicrobium cellulans]|uniref:hypothetical protein n=1 Tax=Cellulosimicrobium cellulans TaxID=1710 RepID=UPI0019658D35|nr:hypothetical protein [Cellulosimicrobium cellulans]MBN0040234.1 hypothetical protein [Cellulosimicrobium cellulans]